jgi:hypothetical protein
LSQGKIPAKPPVQVVCAKLLVKKKVVARTYNFLIMVFWLVMG